MKGDFTRDLFDPTKHYSGVLMQQGRVQLDADWNEQDSIQRNRTDLIRYAIRKGIVRLESVEEAERMLADMGDAPDSLAV